MPTSIDEAGTLNDWPARTLNDEGMDYYTLEQQQPNARLGITPFSQKSRQ
jgi:hypothetical protein